LVRRGMRSSLDFPYADGTAGNIHVKKLCAFLSGK